MKNRAHYILFETWRDAELFQQKYAVQNNPLAHHYNKVISSHLAMANGKDRKVRGRAKAVLRHFVKWQEAEEQHKEKYKKPFTMDDLAAQKPKALKAWRHYKRHIEPKEKRYYKAMWLLKQETDTHELQKQTHNAPAPALSHSTTPAHPKKTSESLERRRFPTHGSHDETP